MQRTARARPCDRHNAGREMALEAGTATQGEREAAMRRRRIITLFAALAAAVAIRAGRHGAELADAPAFHSAEEAMSGRISRAFVVSETTANTQGPTSGVAAPPVMAEPMEAPADR